MANIIKYDACDLSTLIEEVYGHDFNVPYNIMQDQRKITVDVWDETDDAEEQKLIAEFVKRGEDCLCLPNRVDCNDLFQALINDLCKKGKLKEGEYLLEFDD